MFSDTTSDGGSMGLGGAVTPGSGAYGNGFPEPFFDFASSQMPETISLMNRYAEFIVMSNGTYRQALNRVISYFLTDIEITDASDDERDKWEDFLSETLDIRHNAHTGLFDWGVYGNGLTSVLPCFKRYLACPKCGFEAPLSKVYNEKIFAFKWANYEFNCKCPKCKASEAWRHIDRRVHHAEGFRIKRWNIHEIELLWDPMTDEVNYIWKIPEDYRKMIREGHLYHLERAPWEVIQAVKHNNYLLFDKDIIYHMKEPALCGIRNRGWGISNVLTNFRQAWYVQVLHRYNEAIALDYVIPFRVITPEPGDKSAGTDPLLNYNMGDYSGQVMSMIRRRRKDPATWHFLPFAVKYQALGGDASQLAPRELMDQGIDALLNAIGVPAEMYKGTLTMQAAPTALRLFEASWSILPHNLNNWLKFIIKRASQLLNWEPVNARFSRVTHADDIQRQMAKLQLLASNMVSKKTGLGAIGVDNKDEFKRMLDEERYEAEETAKMQDKMQYAAANEAQLTQQQGGQPGQPGQPGQQQPGQQPQQGSGGGGDPSQQQPMNPADQVQQQVMQTAQGGDNQQITPEELQEQAQSIASQLAGQPQSIRTKTLRTLKSVNPTLHHLVTGYLEDYRTQARSQGQDQVMQQTFGKQSMARVSLVNLRGNKPSKK